MKTYKKKNEVLVFYWTGGKSTIDEINEGVKLYNLEHNSNLKAIYYSDIMMEIKCLDLSCIVNIVKKKNKGEYIIFDTTQRIPLWHYSESFLKDNYIEI